MKHIILFFTLLTSVLLAEEYHTFHELGSKRMVEGKMMSKDTDGGFATIITKDNRVLKLDVTTLDHKDQTYIDEWIKEVSPVDQLTVKVVKSTRIFVGYDDDNRIIIRGDITRKKVYRIEKELQIDVVASKDDVTVKSDNINEIVKAGTTRTLSVKVSDNYSITLTKTSDGSIIDQETDSKKTGITKIIKK